MAYIRKQGGTHSISLFNKTLELFHLLDQFEILLIPTHLPGARNVTADTLSQLNNPSPTEWRLPQKTLLNLFSVLGTPHPPGMVPKFIPKIQRPELIPKPLEFPGIAHLFPKDFEWLLCPVRVLGLYLIRSADQAKEDPHQKLFEQFSPETQLFTTPFRRWVAETIRLTYKNSSESDLPKVRAHDVRAVAASIAYYRNTPLSELCGLIGWKSSNVFVRH